MSSMAKMKKGKDLQVHIVEQHNDVVPPIHRAIASRLLPFSSAAMVHLDSHPDLLIPVHMQADTVFKPADLYEALSIENWILPLVYAKHFDHIVWVKPPWAQQIPISKQRFFVGQCMQSGFIRVTSKENYFLTDGLFRPALEMSKPSFVTLQVEEVLPKAWIEIDPNYQSLPSDQNSEQNGSWVHQIQDSIKDKSYVLDIDLDFFSTANPFKDLLDTSAEQALKRLYSYKTPTEFSDETIASFTETREKQLNLLEEVFSELETERLQICAGQTTVPEVEMFSAALDKARTQGLTEDRIQDLCTLCQTVIKQSISKCQAPLEKSSSSNINHAGENFPVLPTSLDTEISCPSRSSSSFSTENSTKYTSCDKPTKEHTKLTSCNGSSNKVSVVDELQSQAVHQVPIDPPESLTFLQLHDFGCTLDDTDLPHHLSTEPQVTALMKEVKIMLESLPRPALVTIARSSDDGYCPKREVDKYQTDVLRMLGQAFGTLHVTKHHEQ